MIWVLFAIAAGVATWAAIGMRSGAVERRRGQPLLWSAGTTAAVLLALGVYAEVQEQRMLAQIMNRTDDLLGRGAARAEVRRAEFQARRDEFDRDFKARQDAFDRSFEEHGERFDRAIEKHRAAVEAGGPPNLDGRPPSGSDLVR